MMNPGIIDYVFNTFGVPIAFLIMVILAFVFRIVVTHAELKGQQLIYEKAIADLRAEKDQQIKDAKEEAAKYWALVEPNILIAKESTETLRRERATRR